MPRATFPPLENKAEPAGKDDIFAAVQKTPAAQDLLRQLENGGVLSLGAVAHAAQPFLIALLGRLFPDRTVVAVTDGLKSQEIMQQDVETWLNQEPATRRRPCLFYPAWEVLPHEARLPHADVISERLETLVALSAPPSLATHRRPPVIVTAVTALLQRTFRPEDLATRTRKLARGDRLEPLDLIEWLEDQGYEPEAKVTQKGELSLRGGILDLWPPTCPWPVRLEFFGSDLESLRHFDPHTQISREEINGVTIPPAGELGLLRKTANTLQTTTPDTAGSDSKRPSGRALQFATLLDHLPRETIFVLCDPDSLDLHAAGYAQQVQPDDPFFISWSEFCARLESAELACVELRESESLDAPSPIDEAAPSPADGPHAHSSLDLRSLDAFRPLGDRPPEPQVAEAQRREFFAQLHRWLRQGHAVHVFCNNDGERQRFQEIWQELGFDQEAAASGVQGSKSQVASPHSIPDPGLQTSDFGPRTHLGALSRGFLCEAAKLAVVTDAEVFGRYKVQRPRRLKSPHAAAMRSALDIDFTDLVEGDYVVHLQHGIGRYRGLKFLAPASQPADSDPPTPNSGVEHLVIEYAPREPDQPPPLLYVPVTEAHLVSKYVGAGKAHPPLHTLGGTRWQKAREQAEKAVRDLAAELLRVQAVRESQPGLAFPADTPWQREFESAFLYEETPDQLRAITAAKTDMESPRPMDRLICGDVGFGKTEVAIRAAFKAVMSGRQVAVLVPTTVLAQQHFNTFRERMADYPVRIELLSRFRTRREQTKVSADLAAGAVDIVIGTHRLIQDDVKFKELGLVVVDEEQRFGVLHKEKFKLLRTSVDVLTLSATPIPRTLYLALTGARDMSTIETPPQDRLPVETSVVPYDERLIRDAIQRELNRGGQVFFLHNRVHSIEAMGVRLNSLVPQARIVVGHGQMPSDELEEVMTQFVNGEADVLLSTTIIESGLDIPNANTIIIDRADRFGLSDLYQLRGRVGRYKHQAYAYLLIPRHAGLLSDARKRISAIKQYSTLGSGFKIAMRDLEIRGAGNLLGPEQSGHITAVGFELYCQLLKQSVSVLKGEPVKRRVEVQMRIDFLALSPGEEAAGGVERTRSARRRDATPVTVPREVATWDDSDTPVESLTAARSAPVRKAAAYLPFDYIPESQQRIDVYRKLAQVNDSEDLKRLRAELRDRFGPLPPPVELLLLGTELKLLAGPRGVSAIETQGDKLMLTRNNDYLMTGGKFPRLTKKDARARLNEIKKLLLAI